ncbi:unnamed protein product, partial [Onchocerca ochengi]|uniref:IS5/IS1182 family transposase n=1 Tax=Onchocerca ochengi TaxID=42157 RepID=A0A182EY24_ONCOC
RINSILSASNYYRIIAMFVCLHTNMMR